MSGEFTEEGLIQKTTADFFEHELGWRSIYAYNTETFGENGTLGRRHDGEVVLVRYLRRALERYNPGLEAAAYEETIKQILASSVSKNTLQINREKYALFKNGVVVSFRNAKGEIQEERLKMFNFDHPADNDFLVVRELWISRTPYRRRADLVGFVNGIPLLFIEVKNIHRDIRRAYDENLQDYLDAIPHLFEYNGFCMLSNGEQVKVGSFAAKWEHFHQWKRLSEEDVGVIDLETALKGMCSKKNFMDIFENYIVFDESKGKLAKILARNHQFLGVNRAIESVRQRQERDGKLGVFWHTQGAGKSYSMLFFAEKVHRKLAGNFTFLVLTDREDLDNQIYKTFAGCGLVDHKSDDCRAGSNAHLKKILKENKPYVFSMIHKFHEDVEPGQAYTEREDIIVISDEAHRTQYGRLALNMRNALPRASYIGFTGTPLFKDDELTKRLFGDYVSTYDFQRAIDDNATVPLYYDSRGEKLHITTDKINERIAEKLEDLDFNEDERARLEFEMSRDYHIITADVRLDQIAADFVEHYTRQWESGKAVLVCIDKITAVRMYEKIMPLWQQRIVEAEKEFRSMTGDQEEMDRYRRFLWLKETEIAVIVSEEQGEVKRFAAWNLDIVPHRTKIKSGYETQDGKRIDVDTAFKDPEHPFRVAIVCAMWLTGFDVPSLSTLYLDKPLKAHTLMQAIARANRVYEGKNNGLIVDYCGILKNLREALATFAVGEPTKPDEPHVDPLHPADEDLLADLVEAIEMVEDYLQERDFNLHQVLDAEGFSIARAIMDAKEVINQSEETRKRFQILAREVFKKWKACLNVKEAMKYRRHYKAIDIIYKKLEDDARQADITEILQQLHAVVDDAIGIEDRAGEPDDRIYDISKIDFERLKEEFKKHNKKNTTVQCLKNAVEQRLQRMIAKNPTRTDFYERYQEIIQGYNSEKDRRTIELTFEQLLSFIEEMDDEEKRAVREGLDEEQLALFDILLKPNISKKDRKRVKAVAGGLLEALKAEKLRIENWRDKESTVADVHTFIRDFLWDEERGLPVNVYSIDEVSKRTELVFAHVYRQYADGHHAYAA